MFRNIRWKLKVSELYMGFDSVSVILGIWYKIFGFYKIFLWKFKWEFLKIISIV